MSIEKIPVSQLRRMKDQEGLIIRGCGGDLQEWVDGINEILTDKGILKESTRFEKVYTFQHNRLTCLLFMFENSVQIDIGRLAMWRLITYGELGSTWLSDYVPNELGGFTSNDMDAGD